MVLDLLAHLVHVERLGLLDQLLERGRRQRARLAEQEQAVAEQHQRGDGLDAGGARELLLGLGVDLAERDVAVGLGRLLEHGRERTARTAPLGPEVEQDDSGLLDRLAEVVRRDLYRCHGTPYSTLALLQARSPGFALRRRRSSPPLDERGTCVAARRNMSSH